MSPDADPGHSTTSPGAVLRTGTVTFMFTDIAGSTRMLIEFGQGYGELLARHNRIMRAALAGHGGQEVSTEGDAFLAVFSSAPEAVAAAVDVQRQLHAEDWPTGADMRVRIGLHSGEGQLGGDNYIGLDVNRAARIAAAGHGDQVLVSEATRALVSQAIPEGVGLRDLGEHLLKDLPAPEHIWQLDIDGLEHDFPPLRSVGARPHNLPAATTSLVGREGELAAIRRHLLEQTRLMTLTGVGGAGKTRLALAAAYELLSDHEDGCFFVPLEDARDAAMVTTAVASVFGVREKPDRDLATGVKNHLRQRELLLVLDNFEQVLGAASFVADLLASCPRIRIIVTSRELLHLSSERGFDVPSLSLPDPAHLPPLAALSQYEAVALFIDRATSAKSDFAVTNENAPAVAAICARLDGLPLAIELAAARVRLLTPQAILDRLERRLPLLTGGPRDAPDRQRTLSATIAWSFGLLEEAERRLVTRLSVFAGGWTLEAAEEVCNPAGELGLETLDGLSSLADKSLVRPIDADGETRFGMLQVIREYAAEQLMAGTDAAEIERRHADYVVSLVTRAEPELMGSDIRRWQRRLKMDEDNIRAALRWAIGNNDAERGMRIAGSVWRFWLYWAHLREARDWLEAVMALPGGSEPTIARAKALSALAGVLYWQGADESLAALYEEALEIYTRLGDDRQQGQALMDTAWGALSRGDLDLAMERAEQAGARYAAGGDEASAAVVRAWLTVTPFFARGEGNLDEVLRLVGQAVEINRRAGRQHDAADALGGIAQAHFVAGDPKAAAEAARGALRGFHEMGNVGMYPMGIKAIAAFEMASQVDPQRAVRLAAAADRLFDELGGQLQLMKRFGEPLDQGRSLLSEDEYNRAVAQGRAMTPDEAVNHALEPADGRPAASA